MGEYDIEIKDVQPTIWVYKDPADGKIKEREQSKDERQEQVVPPRGEYVFRIKAFAKMFEMPKSAQYGGGTQEMTRLLLEVVSGPSSKVEGQLTSVLCTRAMSRGSNLGKVYMKSTGLDLDPQMGSADPTKMLEKCFSVYAKQDKLDDSGNRKNTSLAWDTVERADGKPEPAADGDEEDDFQN